MLWPSGKTQRFSGIPAEASLKIVESSEDYASLTDPSGALPDPVSREDLVWHKLKLRKGAVLPNLHLYRLEGKGKKAPIDLQKGTVYFLNLWATWCGPCRKEMPELEKLRPQFQEKGIQLVGISLDQDTELAFVESFARKLGVSYPLFGIGKTDIDKVFAGDQAFIPLSILVDEKGRVADVFAGWSTDSEKRIVKLLE